MIYTNNPDATYPEGVDLSSAGGDVSARIKRMVRNVMTANEASGVPVWSLAADDDIAIVDLCGGITNRLYLVSYDASPDTKVILRTFGSGTELFINRSRENTVFSFLSQAGFGPAFHGLIQNGRLEGYIPSNCLQPAQMKAEPIFPLVAKTVSDLHAFHLPSLMSSEGSEIWLWSTMHRFFHLISEIRFSDEEKAVKLHALQTSVMLAELHHLHAALAQFQAKLTDSVPSDRNSGRLHAFEQVLCHNDLLSGNILLYAPDKNTGHYTGPIRDVYLIDYEYAAYNFRAYDLANHFCEFGGFDFDIVNEFPSDIVRKKFIEIYLKGHSADETVSEEFVEGFHDIVLILCLASHLFWGSWSTVQSSITTLDFDYIGYAKLRFEGYFYHKALFKDLLESLLV